MDVFCVVFTFAVIFCMTTKIKTFNSCQDHIAQNVNILHDKIILTSI